MPSSTFSHTASASAPAATIWDSLQDAETWVGFGLMDAVTNPVVHDGRLVSFDWTATAAGSRHRGTATVGASVPGEHMVLELDSSEIAATSTVTLLSEADTSAITVTLAARSRGLLAGMFWGVVSDALERGLPRQVDQFAARF
ncbi:MAG: hypothetical protein HZA58_09715 [Acidimicrobiia bacterium]|nr:hypothetical protein [Acidimicrobiia bacterium]